MTPIRARRPDQRPGFRRQDGQYQGDAGRAAQLPQLHANVRGGDEERQRGRLKPFTGSDTSPAARRMPVGDPYAVALVSRDSLRVTPRAEDRGYCVRAARARRSRDNVTSLRTTMITAVVWTAAQVGLRTRFRTVDPTKNSRPSSV